MGVNEGSLGKEMTLQRTEGQNMDNLSKKNYDGVASPQALESHEQDARCAD